MLGRIYQIISENVSKTANRIYAQRPHRDGLIRINTKVMQVLRAASTAPSACLRSLKGRVAFANTYGRKLAGVMRRKKRNGN